MTSTEDSIRWVFDPADSFAHVLADPQPDVLVTMCGRRFPTDHTPTFGVAPSLVVCPTCAPHGEIEWPPAASTPTPRPTPTHY
ncbi:MAG: hypothetical protein ACRDSP_09200 [Pseudonocardiaceae bacterium]